MNLKEQIDADIRSAMISKDNIKKEILKFIKGEIQRSEGGLKILSDTDIQKMMRSQIENLKITPSVTSDKEIEILDSYLPSMMSEDEITLIIKSIKETNPNLGLIMKYFNSNHKGLVDNKLVSKVANLLLL